MALYAAKKRDYVWSVKSAPCLDCGGVFHPSVMDFDHRPGEEKKFGMAHGTFSYGWEALKAEIAKCDVVCSNCHRYRTWVRNHPEDLTSTVKA